MNQNLPAINSHCTISSGYAPFIPPPSGSKLSTMQRPHSGLLLLCMYCVNLFFLLRLFLSLFLPSISFLFLFLSLFLLSALRIHSRLLFSLTCMSWLITLIYISNTCIAYIDSFGRSLYCMLCNSANPLVGSLLLFFSTIPISTIRRLTARAKDQQV